MKIMTPFLQKIYDEAYKAAFDKAIKGGEGSGNFGHEGRPGEVGGSAADGGGASTVGNKLESHSDLVREKENLMNKGQGVHSAIVRGSELRNGKVISINKKIYKITSTTASDKFEAREVTSINVDRMFATGGNDNFLSLAYDAEYLQVNEKELVNFFKPLPK